MATESDRKALSFGWAPFSFKGPSLGPWIANAARCEGQLSASSLVKCAGHFTLPVVNPNAGVLRSLFKPAREVMHQTAPWLLREFPLFLVTAAATHLVVSFAQTLMHRELAHHPRGALLFRNHVKFHHTYYSRDHLVSRTYAGDKGNNTPFFLIPVLLVGACTYFILPVDLFVVQAIACAASFYVHVFFDKAYHVEDSWLQRFAWFRRKQELHFAHHRHAGCNFAVIDFFWDRILGTYREPNAILPGPVPAHPGSFSVNP